MNGNTIIKIIAVVLFVILLSSVIAAQTGVFNQQRSQQFQQQNNEILNNNNQNNQQQLQGGSCGANGGGCGCGGGSLTGITSQDKDSQVNQQNNLNNLAAITENYENNGVQKIEVSYKNNGYYPNIITLKQNVPVKMTFDLNTVQGCMRAVQIKALGVGKYLKEGDNVITFTPQKIGTFTMQCSMGMGKATIVVE